MRIDANSDDGETIFIFYVSKDTFLDIFRHFRNVFHVGYGIKIFDTSIVWNVRYGNIRKKMSRVFINRIKIMRIRNLFFFFFLLFLSISY